MSEVPVTLPLFPLKTLLFPGCSLDLQLFEPRYLDMLTRCLKQDCGFGVVGLLGGHEVGAAAAQFSALGCEALIRDWRQLPNGLLGIRVEGGRRFRVETTQVQADQLLQAEVHWLAPGQDLPLGSEQADLLALLATLAEHPLVAGLGLDGLVTGQQALANQLAYLLPFSLEQKLALLALPQPTEQLALIQSLLDRLQGEMLA